MGAGGVLREGGSMDPATSALLTDLYQLNMMQAYLDRGETKTAVFEFFVRKLPRERGFLIAAGLEQVLEFLAELRFTPEELDWLASSGRFGKNLIDYLAGLRFTGAIHAMPEGTVFFPDEPILRVTAALPEAQLVETRLINLLQFQSMIAAKAARMVLAAPSKRIVDFCLRRARAISPVLPVPPRSWKTRSLESRYSGPWRTRTSKCTTMRPRHSRTLLARGPRT